MITTITPDIKEHAIQWRTKYSSDTPTASTGYITKYAISDAPRGNLILVPGMASNCKTEPLMQEFITWGLRHNFDIYTLETFLARFQHDVNFKAAQKNTVPELINLIDRGLTIIDKYSIQKPMQIVAHSAGAVSTISAINQQIAQNRLINIDRITLFAPFISDERFNRIRNYYRGRKSDAEFMRTPIRVENPFIPPAQPRYISVLPSFFEQIINLNITTTEIEQYNFPVTIVAGGRDSKVPADLLHDLYKKLTQMPNKHLFTYVLFPNSNHSFVQPINNNWLDVIFKINPYVSHGWSR
ncbi:MAG: dienelactone hydrolase family protein [Muribaculaceae bacterium]|nr:dienelactone hydrolase family protein [Muribaculaceae bacterium]